MASCANRISALTEGEALSLTLAASSGCDCLEEFAGGDSYLILQIKEKKESLPAVELIGLGRLAKEKARRLSMGQRKRVRLARLLALNRPIWLLDEPSVALDDEGVKSCGSIIAEHRKKVGVVIVATHLPI
ncbi:ABC transporter I family member 1-like [Vitis riparia]|uniref:ABC transporter I family member 1-like n=1 Tax=Vitis riparia TaxID=96939 RepID=UPI00155B1B61|nr:ABC transporter I family member 1-like [Vitis riparia]